MKILLSKVINIKSNKTITVLIDIFFNSVIYKKVFNNIKKIHAHDDLNICSLHDLVYIVNVSPYSKKKFWRVLKIF